MTNERYLSKPIDELEVTVRTYNCLKKAGITTIGDITQKTESEIMSFSNFGRRSLNEVKDIIAAYGLKLRLKEAERLPGRTVEPDSADPLARIAMALELIAAALDRRP